MYHELEIEDEVIELASTEDTHVQDLPSRISDTNAGYHLFNFPHSHEGDYLESLGGCRYFLPKVAVTQ